MTFYTLKYIQNNQTLSKTVLYVLIGVATLALIVFAALYLYNRFNTRYRNLGIIALLFLLLLVGTQYERYVHNNAQKSQAEQIVPFIKGVARDFDVDQSDVLVNSTTLHDGILIRLKAENKNYQLNLNDDNNSYTLRQAHVIDHHVDIKD